MNQSKYYYLLLGAGILIALVVLVQSGAPPIVIFALIGLLVAGMVAAPVALTT